MTAAITTPTAAQERPRIGLSIAVVVACFVVGVAAVITTSGSPPPQTTAASATRSAPPRPPANANADRSAPKPTASAAPTSAATPDGADAPVARQTAVTAIANTPERSTSTTTASDNTTTLIQGRVAYLRCDGLTSKRGRTPCPRDVALERAVWDSLGALTNCKPSLGRGTADVRLDFSRGARTEARVIPIPGSPEPSLDTRQVYACVGRSLTDLTTGLNPLYMMVSFRVALR